MALAVMTGLPAARKVREHGTPNTHRGGTELPGTHGVVLAGLQRAALRAAEVTRPRAGPSAEHGENACASVGLVESFVS
jgi:hypothetical protein